MDLLKRSLRCSSRRFLQRANGRQGIGPQTGANPPETPTMLVVVAHRPQLCMQWEATLALGKPRFRVISRTVHREPHVQFCTFWMFCPGDGWEHKDVGLAPTPLWRVPPPKAAAGPFPQATALPSSPSPLPLLPTPLALFTMLWEAAAWAGVGKGVRVWGGGG